MFLISTCTPTSEHVPLPLTLFTLTQEDPLVKHLRAQFVTAEELERQDFVTSRRTCKWTGPKKYEPLAGAWGAR